MWAEATEAIQKFETIVKSSTGYPVQLRPSSASRPQPEQDLHTCGRATNLVR
jgi:hypothetical protein